LFINKNIFRLGIIIKRYILLLSLVLILVACKKDYYGDPPDDFAPPFARLRAYPEIGDSTTWFRFSGHLSRDASSCVIIDFRWDINADGIWDTPFTIKNDWVHVFPEPGFYNVILQVADRYHQTSIDTVIIETYGKNNDTGYLTDPRDGQVYKTVRIAGLEWMAENLNYGSYMPVNDTSRDNDIVEKYSYDDNPDLKEEYGGYYTYYDWMEMMNHDTTSIQGICPPGWELPTREDWRLIIEYPRRPLDYFAQGGLSSLHLSRMLLQPRLQEWDQFDISEGIVDWTYFTRDFYTGYMNGPDNIIPYVVSSKTGYHPLVDRGNIYAIQYASDSVRKHFAIAPVRCIKRN